MPQKKHEYMENSNITYAIYSFTVNAHKSVIQVNLKVSDIISQNISQNLFIAVLQEQTENWLKKKMWKLKYDKGQENIEKQPTLNSQEN